MTWVAMNGDDDQTVAIEWVERGGPPVDAPRRRGFGSQLLERVLNSQIGARATISYHPDGLWAHVEVPLMLHGSD